MAFNGKERKKSSSSYKRMTERKWNPDSYRLLDIILMAFCTALSIIILFMVSLGYSQIHTYMPEIEQFPYFLAYLPAFLSSLIHASINYFLCKNKNVPLIDFTKLPAKKRGVVGLYVALIGAVISLIFIILLLAGAIPAEDYLYVLASLPVGLGPYVYFLIDQVLRLRESFEPRKKEKIVGLIIGFSFPVILGLASYLPGVFEWGYAGISFIPLVYLICDSLSMKNKGSDIENLDDL